MNTLSIQNLSLIYNNKTQAIDDISLELQNGMFGLLGPNGAGKSSLMKTIVGLQRPTSGHILFNGISTIENPDILKRQLGFLPQDFNVYPAATTCQLLEHLAILKGMNNTKKRREQIDMLLHNVNLYDARNKEVRTFSGGMKQRFGVAQALLGSPKLIIVDEPTAGLDPEERNRFNGLLTEISREIIVILSTHLVEDVRNLCSNMAVMQSGKLLCFGKPSKLTMSLKEKIWIKSIPKSELSAYQMKYRVISYQFIESEMLITVFSKEQPPGFQASNPTLEHFYFFTLNQNN